jgi:hypothetical protein
MEKYAWITRSQVKKFLPEIEQNKVSEVARSDRGFLTNFIKFGKKMKNMKVPDENVTWNVKRNNFISRTLPVYQKNKTYRRFLSLIAWAYNPNLFQSSK